MTTATPDRVRRVLVVSGDGRVSQALAALLNANTGLDAYTASGTPCDVDAVVTSRTPDVAVVDVTLADLACALRLVRRLARRFPVVAVTDSPCLGARANAAGAHWLCDKNGDPDSLATTVAAAARSSLTPRPTSEPR